MDIGLAFDLKSEEGPSGEVPEDWEEEFDSPITIAALTDVFQSLGHHVRALGNGRKLLESLLKHPPDFLFNLAEGVGVSRSREARVPAVCEMLGIAYSGSDPLALSLSLDKDLTRKLAKSAGVAVPAGLTISFPSLHYDGQFAEFPGMLAASGLNLPVIAKPVYEGSSKGIRRKCLIESLESFGPTVFDLWSLYRQPILVEEFISGEEITVGIIGNDPPHVLGVMQIMPKQPTEHFVYSLEVKRDFRNLVNYECPARLPVDLLREIEASALTVFEELGCRDFARVDFRLRDGVAYFLEINPLPGLNPESSDLVIMANLLGVSHKELVMKILNCALDRWGLQGR